MNYQHSYPAGRTSLSSNEPDFTTLLEGATKDDLQELMDDEDRINEIICDQEKIKQLRLDKELLQAENRSIADHNISKEPFLQELRTNLGVKYEKLKELQETFRINQAKMDSLHKDVNLETMLAVLQTTCAETEEQSEALADKLFQGDLPVNEFIATFKAKRTQAHMRHIKMEKMRELVLEVQRNSSSSSSGPAIPPRVPSKPAPVYPGSAHPTVQPMVTGGYPARYAPPPPQALPQQYPGANAFSRPNPQQYSNYKWN